ncbi:uncharacterized protein TEOVI_000072400 [Trypanosoma equiperdum]|uniref:Uncharacterized protein n=4 Tax=Trypanozoon TaxID=39700 RepID=Q585M0_TRYB2|nr:hypothetical protein, conserved [Trypanosoma brucei gambiense DAL972]XP_845312.1 hypothetical protein, conserved [Trypanosoma brucei brucei TREU927]AAX79726.1 hypothetical protein, conserved [Trypanosoma brucei]RHW71764.1 hypothetical protein DPX39_060022200 [Trypanosoma brucei equiperdum]SCU69167.1 hypothetical protein, conserved [Trypanosoma equiperdum]AAZ11753.1 hypothetical protein, conserved [Trypanosoma brucei brucei TREU927]CBH11683.1 hypothetical protein, conserved [Trypanosoma bru|eukprot:XP_011773968.1 hypothetical protein, conserved [Trypanosoma brucei gambiense DAL972]
MTKEEVLSSAQRIQLLRERLEMYNATIVEAMGVVAGTANNEEGTSFNGGESASPPSSSRIRVGHNGVNSSLHTIRKSKTDHPYHVERGNAADFESSRVVGGDSRRGDRRAAPPPPPSPPKDGHQRDLASRSVTMTSEITGEDHDSTLSFSESEDYYEEACASEQAFSEGMEGSAGDTLQNDGRQSPTLAHTLSRGENAAELAASHSGSWTTYYVKSYEGEDSQDEEIRSYSRSQKGSVVIRGDSQELLEAVSAQAPLPTPPPGAAVFTTLESTLYKMLFFEQSLRKLLSTIDFDHFPRSLPQEQKGRQLAEARDQLIEKERALRNKKSGEPSISDLRDNDATVIVDQIQHLLLECENTKGLFQRVYERKASVSGKERLLQQRLSELESRQREVGERRKVLTALESRLEEQESALLKREGKYRSELEAHKERDSMLQGRIGEVESLTRKVSSWMKILEERDAEMAAKEQRLRRVQTDLLRRSEGLLCYRNGKAKESARIPPRLEKTP